jgi:hypothetical protein
MAVTLLQARQAIGRQGNNPAGISTKALCIVAMLMLTWQYGVAQSDTQKQSQALVCFG